MSIGIRSGSLVFNTIEDMNKKFDSDLAEFVSKVKIKLIEYLQESNSVPIDTGLMSDSAQYSVAQAAAIADFYIEVFFDTEYAKYVHRKGEKGTHFFPKVEKELEKIFFDSLRDIMKTFGWNIVI